MSARYCPRCIQPMNSGRLGPVTLELCLRCGGVWFPAHGLATVLGAGSRPLWRLVEGIRAARQGGKTCDRPPSCPSCSLSLHQTTLPLPIPPPVAVETAGATAGSVPAAACLICEGHWTEVEVLGGAAAALTTAESAVAAPPPARPSRPDYETQASGKQPEEWKVPWAGSAPRPSGDPCPGCGALNPRHTPLCLSCGRMLQGDPVGTCPHCEGTLHHLNSLGVEFAVCGGCGGVLLEVGSLDALLMQSGVHQEQAVLAIRKLRTGRQSTSHAHLHCPRCRLVMFESTLGIISTRPGATCPQCRRLFLDNALIEQLLLGR